MFFSVDNLVNITNSKFIFYIDFLANYAEMLTKKKKNRSIFLLLSQYRILRMFNKVKVIFRGIINWFFSFFRKKKIIP